MQVTEELSSWDAIVSVVKSGNVQFGRTKSVMDSYSEHKAAVKKEWRDMNSYCKHRMLGYPYSTEVVSVTNENRNELLQTQKFVHDYAECTGERIMIRDNEFPYAFSTEVIHKVIWSADDLNIEEYEQHVKKFFSEKDYDIVMFINPIHQKSVKGVHHAHALLRARRYSFTKLVSTDAQYNNKFSECLEGVRQRSA